MHGLQDSCLGRKWELQLQTMNHTQVRIIIVAQLRSGVSDKIIAIATDNAVNAAAAVCFTGWRHIPCFANIVKGSLSSAEEMVTL